MASELRTGTAVIDVTPPVGTFMGGYASRDHGAEGVHDPLMAKALALTDGETTVILLTCDIISFDYDFTDALRAAIEENTGVPADNILVSNSHTHSGPLTPGVLADYLVDDDYIATVAEKLRSIAEIAAGDMQPATVGFARGDVRVGYNRRETTPEGIALGMNLEGPLARFVDVMAVRDAEGTLLATWFCHAAHAVVMGGDNYLLSADYPGYAQRAIEAVHPQALAMFAQGCCGDINVERGRPGTFEEARSRGHTLAGAVLATIEKAKPLEDVKIAVARENLELPLLDPPPAEELEAQLAEMRPAREAAQAEGDAVQEQVLRWRIMRRERLLELAREGARDMTERFDVTVLRIGSGAIVGLPGEVFVEYALTIDAHSPFSPTIVPAYTNGMIGYVPTASAFPEGGYEVDTSREYYGTQGLRPEAHGVILAGVQRLLLSLEQQA